MPISRKPDALVVDANPILSALMGGQASRIFFDSGIQEFAVPALVLDEVRRYVPRLSKKLGIGQEFLFYALELLPLTVYQPSAYRRALSSARQQIAPRDPHDVEILALALALQRVLWTNDRDFEVTQALRVTTAELLHWCFPRGSKK